MSQLTAEEIRMMLRLRRVNALKPRNRRMTTREIGMIFGVSEAAVSYHTRLRSQPRRSR